MYTGITKYSDEFAILFKWTMFKLWCKDIIRQYGAENTIRFVKSRYPGKGPDDFFWHPVRLHRYVQFSKAVIELIRLNV